jgi:biopolymer transport protein TolR
MGMSAGGGGDDELASEINVTPLVDVMLVLLIIFMITAPMMNTGVSLELPQVTAQNVEDPEGKLVLSMACVRARADGESPCVGSKIFLGGTQVLWKDLEAKLKANDRVQKESALYIEADNDLPYGLVITAMALAKNSGVAHVMMLTNPTESLDLVKLDQNVPVPGASK